LHWGGLDLNGNLAPTSAAIQVTKGGANAFVTDQSFLAYLGVTGGACTYSNVNQVLLGAAPDLYANVVYSGCGGGFQLNAGPLTSKAAIAGNFVQLEVNYAGLGGQVAPVQVWTCTLH
jgi:hypothetical protein